MAAIAGRHVPGTAYNWSHGWEPLTAKAALAKVKGNRKAAEKLLRMKRGDGVQIEQYHARRGSIGSMHDGQYQLTVDGYKYPRSYPTEAEASKHIPEAREYAASAKKHEAKVEAERQAKAAEDAKKASEASRLAAERRALEQKYGEPLASERQINYIMDLLRKRRPPYQGFFNGPMTREEIAKLPRSSASMYIASLRGDY